MKKEIKRRTDLFLKNRKILKDEVKLESEYNYLFGAMMYSDENRVVDKKAIERCNKILKENTSIFSDFRTFSFPIIIKMALNKNPKKYLKDLQTAHDLLTKKNVFASYFKLLTAMIVCDYEKEVEVDTLAKREKKVFDIMKKNHPFLTNEEDMAFATLFALSGKKEDALIEEMENNYSYLKNHIKEKNCAQAISEILVLENGKWEDKLTKTVELYKLLKASKKIDHSDFTYAILGLLAVLKEDSKTIVQDILEVDHYIGSQKGKGLWTIGKNTRLMISMLIVESVYCKNNRQLKGISLMNTIMMEQILTYIICMAILID